jgi:membrane-associated phospholipid phosphatase
MALALGCGLAVLVALSRIVVNAHSPSEIVGGLALGAAASAAIVRESKFARAHLNPVLPSLLVLWVVFTPFQMPPSRSHALVTRIALAVSGHSVPFTRQHFKQALPAVSP